MDKKTTGITANKLIPKEAIIQHAIAYKEKPPISGIYFLISSGEIVYVGRSVNINARIECHSRDKVFDSYSFYLCGEDEKDYLEPEYILYLKPIYNRSVPKNDIYITVHGIKKQTKLDKRKINICLAENKCEYIEFLGILYYKRSVLDLMPIKKPLREINLNWARESLK